MTKITFKQKLINALTNKKMEKKIDKFSIIFVSLFIALFTAITIFTFITPFLASLQMPLYWDSKNITIALLIAFFTGGIEASLIYCLIYLCKKYKTK